MKFIFIFAVFPLFLLGGCGDPHYKAEKYFWYAEQKAKKIMVARANKLQPEDYIEIIQEYRKVIEVAPVDPLSAKTQFLIANLFSIQKNYSDAQKELKRIVQNFFSDKTIASKACFAMGKLWELQGRFDDALDEYKKIIDFYPLSFLGMEMPLYMTQLCEKNKEKITGGWAYSQMIRHYESLIEEYKGTSIEHSLQNYLIRAYLKGENWDDMLKIWDDQINAKSDKTSVIAASLSKAKLQATKLNNIPEAIKICEDLIQKFSEDPSVPNIRFYIGQLKLENGETDKAGDTFSSILKDYPEEKELGILCHFALVVVDEKKGANAEAIIKLKKIRELFPEHPRSLAIPFLIYQNYEKLRDQANAAIAMKAAVNEYSYKWKQGGKEQNDLITGKLLLRCYLQMKDWDSAAQHLQSFDERFPQTPYFLLLQAAIYADKMKLPLKARNVYDTILKKYSRNSKLTKAVEELVQNLDDKTVKTDE